MAVIENNNKLAILYKNNMYRIFDISDIENPLLIIKKCPLLDCQEKSFNEYSSIQHVPRTSNILINLVYTDQTNFLITYDIEMDINVLQANSEKDKDEDNKCSIYNWRIIPFPEQYNYVIKLK
jgi:hypothetical protein